MVKTIVVGYDETDSSRRALARAAELAAEFDSKVIVTSVARVLAGARGLGPVDPVDSPELHLEELDHARTFLGERGIDGQFEMTVGDPATAIVELADRCEADLIVVGTRQLSFVSNILGVSVSGSVTRGAHCDVLTVQ